MSIHIRIQNASGRNNLCFYNSVFGAGREFFKQCTIFSATKNKINPIILRQENLNADSIIDDHSRYLQFEYYFKGIKGYLEEQIYNPINAYETIEKLEEDKNMTWYLTVDDKKQIKVIKNDEDDKKLEKIKNVYKNSIGLADSMRINKDTFKLIVEHNILQFDYTPLSKSNTIKLKDFLRIYLKFQIDTHQFATHIETDLFKTYLKKHCPNLAFRTISSKIGVEVDIKNIQVIAFLVETIYDFFKAFLEKTIPETNIKSNINTSLVILYTSNVHYQFLIINNKSIFTFDEIKAMIIDLKQICRTIIRDKNKNVTYIDMNSVEYIYSGVRIKKYEQDINADNLSPITTSPYSPDIDPDPEDDIMYILAFPNKINKTVNPDIKIEMMMLFNKLFKDIEDIELINSNYTDYRFKETHDYKFKITILDPEFMSNMVKIMKESVINLHIVYQENSPFQPPNKTPLRPRNITRRIKNSISPSSHSASPRSRSSQPSSSSLSSYSRSSQPSSYSRSSQPSSSSSSFRPPTPPNPSSPNSRSSSNRSVFATSNSPPRNMLKVTKSLNTRTYYLNKILNFSNQLTDLFNNPKYDDELVKLLLSKINEKFKSFKKLKKLQIEKKGKFYKFNYKNVETYLSLLSDKELKSIEIEIDLFPLSPSSRNKPNSLSRSPSPSSPSVPLVYVEYPPAPLVPPSPNSRIKPNSSNRSVFVTSNSPPRNMLKVTKSLNKRTYYLNKILNFSNKLTDLFNNPKYDNRLVELLLNKINIKFKSFKKLKKLQIEKKGEFYKFNYKNVETYLSLLSDTELKSIEIDLDLSSLEVENL